MDVVKINGFKIIKNSLDIVPLNNRILINTISPNSYGIAVHNERMRNALKKADYLVLDGVYFGLAPLLYKRQKIKRITGWNCFQYFSTIINKKKGKVFFLGSTQKTLEKIKTRYNQEFPDIEIDFYSPPFKTEFSVEDNELMHNKINNFSPDVLFIGLTAPKQEIWGYENKTNINANVICTIGNVFDWYAGNSKRPGKFWQKIGLEWLVRIFYRPEILERNTRNQFLFLWHLITFKFWKI